MTSRLLAGWWTRRGTHAALVAAVAVVTVGALAVTGDRGRPELLAPLLALAAGVVPSAGLALGAARRHEAALLRLHGRNGVGWALALTPEPLLSAVLGGAVGVAAAAVAGVGRWDVVALVWGLSTAVILVSMLVALRGPLVELLRGQTGVDGLRESGALGWTGPVLVLVAAVVALVRGIGSSTEEPDAVTYAAPALVGIAVGLIAVHAVRLLARWLSSRPDLASALAGRRLSLARSSTGVPLLVGSAVLLGLGANTVLALHAWEADTRLVTAPAPLVVPFDGSAEEVLEATREADPDGRWLMAAVRVFQDDRAVSRRVYVDAARYERVVGDRLDDTAAAAGSAAVVELGSAAADTPAEPTTTGQRMAAELTLGGDRRRAVLVDVLTSGVSGSGRQTVNAWLSPGRPVTLPRRLSRCEPGCRITGLEVAIGPECPARSWARPVCRRPSLDITHLTVGGLDLLQRSWTLAEPDDRPPGEVESTPGRLRVRPSSAGTSYVTTDRSPWAAPVLATQRVDWADGPEAPTPGGLARPTRVLDTVPALPLVGAGGSVLDLPSSLLPGAQTVADAEPIVLARADTPDAVLDRIGASVPGATLAEDAVARSAARPLSTQVAVVVGGGALLGLVGVLLPTARRRDELAREHAVLRLIGVPQRVRRGSSRLQVSIVVVVATLAAAGGTLLVTKVFGDVVALLDTGSAQLPLDTGPRVGSVLMAGLLAMLGTGATTGWAQRVADSASRPERLREDVHG